MVKVEVVKKDLTFEEALFALREGRAVRRKDNVLFNFSGTHLMIRDNKIVHGQWKNPVTDDVNSPVFYSSFKFTSDDILSEDWEIIKEIKQPNAKRIQFD